MLLLLVSNFQPRYAFFYLGCFGCQESEGVGQIEKRFEVIITSWETV